MEIERSCETWDTCAMKAIMAGCSCSVELFEPYVDYGSVGPNIPVCPSVSGFCKQLQGECTA